MNVFQIVRAFLDGFILRCPRCHRGHMFARAFDMRLTCPECGLRFESATGEVVGGMAVNTIATCTLIVAMAVAFMLVPETPVIYPIAGLIAFGTLFPVAFYRSARGMWASFLYVTGSNAERD
jgi:uncharacterized protein (DUF983 family)